jgi:secreted Zn-dependent insulinase-like peptidase
MISEISFKFLEDGSNSPLNDITFLSESVSKNPIEKILNADFLFEKFDTKIIKKYLKNLMDTQNLIIIVADNQYKYSE